MITKIQSKFIIENYPKMGAKKISKILNISAQRVYKHAKQHNIKFIFIKPTINNVAKMPEFLNISKPEIPYLLGFIWADGHLKQSSKNFLCLTINFIMNDYKIIKDILHKYINWHVNFCEPLNKQKQANLYCSHKELCLFLKRNDYLKKSYKTPQKILSIIPKDLHFYFWRGYFDGDGCISFKEKLARLSVSANIDYDWKDLINLLNKMDIEYSLYKKQTKTGNCSSLEVCRQNDIIKLFKYFYPTGFDFGFKRKFDKLNSVEPISRSSPYKYITFNKKLQKYKVAKKNDFYLGYYGKLEDAKKALDDYIKE